MSFKKEPYLRYKIIDECISNWHYPSLTDILEACYKKFGYQLSKETILKDISAMKFDPILDFRAPIKYSGSHKGYYYEDREYRINKASLNEEEIESLKTMLEVLNIFSGTGINENFNVAVNKIFASLHERFPEGKEKVKIIQTDNTPAQKGFEFFELFLKAAKEKKPISFVHYSYRKREFEAEIISVYFLKEFQSKWYIIGYSESKKRIKTYSFESIYEPFLLKHTFVEKEKENSNNYFNNMYGVYPIEKQKLQKIEFRVRPFLSDYLMANPLHLSQERVEEFEYGAAIFSLKLIPSHELIDFFSLHCKDLIVIKPKWIQEKINNNHRHAFHHEKR
jgi:predicted DNA-binding transcriptional regulator YafY